MTAKDTKSRTGKFASKPAVAAAIVLIVVAVVVAVAVWPRPTQLEVAGRNLRFMDSISLSHDGQSKASVDRIASFANNSSDLVRCHTLVTLAWDKSSYAHSVARRLAAKQISDPAWLVRRDALESLQQLHDPSTDTDARQLENDPDARVRAEAQKILTGGTDT